MQKLRRGKTKKLALGYTVSHFQCENLMDPKAHVLLQCVCNVREPELYTLHLSFPTASSHFCAPPTSQEHLQCVMLQMASNLVRQELLNTLWAFMISTAPPPLQKISSAGVNQDCID